MWRDTPTFAEVVGATAFLAVILILGSIGIYALVMGGLTDNTYLTFVLGVFAGISASGSSFFLRGKRIEPSSNGTNENDTLAPSPAKESS